jgi:cell division GTPase FtsZ
MNQLGTAKVEITGELLSGMEPELPAQFPGSNFSPMQIPVSSVAALTSTGDDQHARIKVVGIGPLASRMVQILYKNQSGIFCHEDHMAPKHGHSEQMADYLSSIRGSDLLFILTGLENEYFGEVARSIGRSAGESGVLTLAVIPDNQTSLQKNSELRRYADTVFTVSDDSLTGKHEHSLYQGTLTGYAMRHVVSAITNMILQRSFICVDFADIVSIMRGGNSGKLGVGVTAGHAKGRNAAILAMNRLASQNTSTLTARGILTIVQGSSLFTMDDFAEVSEVIHDHAAVDANVIIGFITDDHLGEFVKVSVMTVQ